MNTTAAGAASGAFWGTLVGFLFLMPLVGTAIGAASGALGGKLTDVGINDQFMKDTAASPAARVRRAVPADPEDDDRQGAGRSQGHRRGADEDLVRRDEGCGSSREALAAAASAAPATPPTT